MPPPRSVSPAVYRPESLSRDEVSGALRQLGLAECWWSEAPPPPGPGGLYLSDSASAETLARALSGSSPAAVVALGAAAPAGGGVPWIALPADASEPLLASALAAGLEIVAGRMRARELTATVAEKEERIAALNRIGIALSAERDLEKLLEKILTESRRFTRSEAGSLYLVEDEPDGRRLRFKLAQNDAVRFAFQERTMPVDDTSLAGFVASHGDPLVLDDAYAIPEGAPYRHNDSFDVAHGFRTRALLVVPMKDHQGVLVGVLQLMNRHGEAPGTFEPFPADLVPLLLSLATQAAVCLKANQLTASIRKLFEDFARAAIVAVEQRDPTTAGHSNRVADLTTALARIVDRAADGPYRSVTFTREDLREISTAALLHDFGKISVPEAVLLKRAKLEPWSLARIRDRFDYFLEAADAADTRDLLHRLLDAGAAPTVDDLRSLEEARAERARQLEEEFDEVRRANEPTVLPQETGGRLRQLRTRSWRDRRGVVSPLLLDDELALLSIPKGSLSGEERTLIESHVSHTWRFLSSIPWTPDLARIPEIAYAHHEKLNGGGYPRRLSAESIPLPSRILTVCDIYDALTAADRPYKKAVPREKALAILEDEGRAGLLDVWLVETFVTEKVWLGLG